MAQVAMAPAIAPLAADFSSDVWCFIPVERAIRAPVTTLPWHPADQWPAAGHELALLQDAMLAYFDTELTWTELLKRTWTELQQDNGMGLAAQLAYYFFLALFPALLFLIALASFVPADDLIGRVVTMLQGVAPPEVITIIRDQLAKIAEGEQAGLLTFGVAAALWSSSAAMVAIIDALNRAYDVQDARPWWKQRLTALLLTLGVAIFVLVAFALVLAGPELADWIAARAGFGAVFVWTWKIVQWPIVFGLITTAIGFIYYFAPDVEQDFVWITPGSLFATVLWLLGSLAFRFYVVNFGSYNETYGAIGGVMVLMLWLYLTGLVIIIGAEMSAEIEHASPHGKAEGEKVQPGKRKVIGPRAAREFAERQRRPQPAVVRPAAPAMRPRHAMATPMALARTTALVGGVVGMLFGRRV
jgi:membrane protein